MLEITIDRRGEISIENIQYMLENFPGYATRAIASAMKSEGFRLSQLIKLVIAGRGVDGSWPDLNPHTGILAKRSTRSDKELWIKNYRTLWRGEKGSKERYKSYHYVSGEKKGLRRPIKSSRKEPQSRMKNAIGYSFDDETSTLDVSFQSTIFKSRRDKMRFLMHLQAEGYTKVITPRMRKMLFAMGFPIRKDTTMLKVPKRESIQPVFDQQKNTIVKNLDEKFAAALNRYIFGGSA